jgi:hypothetical protein
MQYRYYSVVGQAMVQLAKALRYKSEGRGVTGICHSQNPSGRTVTLRLIQPLTGMST